MPYDIAITSTGTTTVGQAFSLNCSLGRANDPVTYQWFDSNETQLTNDSQLQFSPLRPSDAGLYTCRATGRSAHKKIQGNIY